MWLLPSTPVVQLKSWSIKILIMKDTNNHDSSFILIPTIRLANLFGNQVFGKAIQPPLPSILNYWIECAEYIFLNKSSNYAIQRKLLSLGLAYSDRSIVWVQKNFHWMKNQTKVPDE